MTWEVTCKTGDKQELTLCKEGEWTWFYVSLFQEASEFEAWVCPGLGQELDLKILVGPFPLTIFYDCIKFSLVHLTKIESILSSRTEILQDWVYVWKKKTKIGFKFGFLVQTSESCSNNQTSEKLWDKREIWGDGTQHLWLMKPVRAKDDRLYFDILFFYKASSRFLQYEKVIFCL